MLNVTRETSWLVVGLTAVGLLLGNSRDTPAETREAKPSEYAKADDLVKYVRYLVRQMKEDLADPAEYEEEQQERVAMRAHTLAAIALVLNCHDEKHVLRAGSGKLIEWAGELADHADDFDHAKATYEKIARLVQDDGEAAGGSGKWENKADIAELMKAVPIVNNQMRRGIQSRRFARSAEKTAMYAAALAAIAQASAVDDSYEDDDDWRRMCLEMRNGAAEAGKAVRAGDQEAAKKAAEKIVRTCDACHEDYR